MPLIPLARQTRKTTILGRFPVTPGVNDPTFRRFLPVASTFGYTDQLYVVTFSQVPRQNEEGSDVTNLHIIPLRAANEIFIQHSVAGFAFPTAGVWESIRGTAWSIITHDKFRKIVHGSRIHRSRCFSSSNRK